MVTLDDRVTQLARARAIQAEYQASLDEIRADIQDRYGEALTKAQQYLNTAKQDVADNEELVRSLALIEYARTGDKRPHPAAGIRVYTILDYEPEAALQYCLRHNTDALQLDKRAFEKAAKATVGAVDTGVELGDAADDLMGFATVLQEPRVAIRQDLSEYE